MLTAPQPEGVRSASSLFVQSACLLAGDLADQSCSAHRTKSYLTNPPHSPSTLRHVGKERCEKREVRRGNEARSLHVEADPDLTGDPAPWRRRHRATSPALLRPLQQVPRCLSERGLVWLQLYALPTARSCDRAARQ